MGIPTDMNQSSIVSPCVPGAVRAIGLCGAHRGGKTTLAEALAESLALPFARTSTSAVFARHGLDPAQALDFATRLWIQGEVLAAARGVWGQFPGGFVTDRTPLDFIAYTLADVHGGQSVDAAALRQYLENCFAATRAFFSLLVVVQPGIPLVPEAGKAALNPAYIEHLNSLVLGLCHDERQQCPSVALPRDCLDLAARRRWVEARVGETRAG